MPDEKIARLADALVERGLRHAFGVTGSGASMALIMGLESRGVAYHGVAHEAAAAIMAGTVASTSGRPSVSISIKGPGLANMLPGVAFNHFEGNPALKAFVAGDIDLAHAPTCQEAFNLVLIQLYTGP